jgi:hypothetical protein
MLRRGFYALLITLAAAGSLLAFGAAPAQAANLWHCTTDLDPNTTRACTTVTSAPAGGVEVYDRYQSRNVRLYNGASVVLVVYGYDESGLCGVHDDPYVWMVGWIDGSGTHYAVIGDYYLATGPDSHWRDFRDDYGRLGDQGGTHATGTCDVFPI